MTNSFLLLVIILHVVIFFPFVGSEEVDGLLLRLALRRGLALVQHVLDEGLVGHGPLRLVEDWVALPHRLLLDLLGLILEQVHGATFLSLDDRSLG